MPTTRSNPLIPAVDARQLIQPDALRCAVPVHMGGLGGDPRELSVFIRALCEVAPSAALVFWAQRMAIELLVRADNVALREFLLPDLMCLHKSATVPLNNEYPPLQVSHDGRHLFLSGGDYVVANAQPDGFTFICPARTDDASVAWCLVDSQANGFTCLPHDTGAFAAGAEVARIELQNVFFRGDELLGEAHLASKVSEVQRCLGVVFKDLPRSDRIRAVHRLAKQDE